MAATTPNVPMIKATQQDNTGNAKEPTMRETMELHHSNPGCASCHSLFEPIGLKSHVQHVARVSWAHNVWLTNDHSYKGYEHLLANAQEQEGEIRLSLLAAFRPQSRVVSSDRNHY